MSGLGLMMPSLPLYSYFHDAVASPEGRVATDLFGTYDQPSLKDNQVKVFWRVLVLPITNDAISDHEPA